MKRPANPIVWIVSKLDSCRALLGVLVVFGFGALAEPCKLSYERGRLSTQAVESLKGKGYELLAVDGMTDNLMSLRRFTDTQVYALTNSGENLKIHFEVSAGDGNYPLLSYPYKGVNKVPSCGDFRKQVSHLNKLRAMIKNILPAFSEKGRLLDAYVSVEEALALSKGQEYPSKAVRSFIETAKRESQTVWNQNAEAEPWARVNAVRRHLFRIGLRQYCRDFPTMKDLTERRCTNCVGQTLLIMGIFDFLKIESQGFRIRFHHYSDHLQPIIQIGKRAIDAVYLKRVNPRGAHDPRELLGIALQRWAGLIFEWDKVDSHLLYPPQSMFFKAAGLFRLASSGEEMKATSAYDWSAMPAFSKFGDGGPVSEFADLGYAEDMKVDEKNVGDGSAPGGLFNKLLGRPDSKVKKPSCIDLALPTWAYEALKDNIHPDDVAELKARSEKTGCNESAELITRRPVKNYESTGTMLEITPFRIEFEPQPAVAGLAILPDWISQPDDDLLLVFKFTDKVDYETAKRLRYQERLRFISAKLSSQFQGIFREDLASLKPLFGARDPIAFFLAHPKDLTAAGLRIAYMMQGFASMGYRETIRDESYPQDLLSEVIEIQRVIRLWSQQLAREARFNLSQMNSHSGEEIERFFVWFNQLPLQSLNTYVRRHQSPIMHNDASQIWPTEAFFTTVINDPFSWNADENKSKLHTQQLDQPETKALAANLPAIDLPKVDLKVDCADGKPGVDLNGIYALCPAKPAQSARPPPPLEDLKSQLLIGLMLGNPQMFYHPGNLLFFNALWSKELSEHFYQTALTYDFNFYQRRGHVQASELIRVAMLYRERIITTPLVYELGKLPLGSCERFETWDLSRCAFAPLFLPSAKVAAGRPAWLGANPLYEVMFKKVNLKRPTCLPEPIQKPRVQSWEDFMTYWGHSQLHVIRLADRPLKTYRGTTQIGRWLIDYDLYPDDRGCYLTVEPEVGSLIYSHLAVPALRN